MSDVLAVERMGLDLEKLRARVEIPRNVLISVHDSDDFMRDVIVVEMLRTIATIPGERELLVADGPWQAWKEKYLDVLLRWMPVRHRRYDARGHLPDFIIPRGWGGVAARWRRLEEE